MFLESSVVHINDPKASSLPFSKLDPIHSLGKLHGFCYFIIAHTQPFFMCESYGLVVKALDYQSSGPVFKTTGWLQG